MKHFLIFLLLIPFTKALALTALSKKSNSVAHQFMLGKFQITTISDGFLMMEPYRELVSVKPEVIKQQLQKHFLADKIETSNNTFLINTGSKLILVDTGWGKAGGENSGHILESLKTAGYSADQIDIILITHGHSDHVDGLTSNGKITFPNATVYVEKNDLDFSTANFSPYQKNGSLKVFSRLTEIVPGIVTRDCSGHTPGHTCYEVKSGNEKLVLVGDLFHIASVQVEYPTAGIIYDTDSKEAAETRERVLNDASVSGEWIAGAHLAFPGVGHIRKEKTGYAYVPANYQH